MVMVEATKNYSPGLEGVIAGISAISEVNPDRDSLLYRGYDIRELSQMASFEEVAYLLIYGELPSAPQYDAFKKTISAHRELPAQILETLGKLPKTVNYMDSLRTGVSMLAHFDPQTSDLSHQANIDKATRLLAAIPTIIAASYRYSKGQQPVAPNPALSHSQNFFYMLGGETPPETTAKVFDTTMILYAEHGFNASTFAARVTASTLSDLHSAITSAIGTLKGSLHGGANEEAMKMLLEIGSEEKAEAWVMDALTHKKKIMGFGHRVYKKGDTRAPILKKMGESLCEELKQSHWHRIADTVEQVMFREKGLYTNVDFPTSYIYYVMGLPIELYTPLFAASRITGWSAHVIEQLDNNRLIRPKSEYNGPAYRAFKPVSER